MSSDAVSAYDYSWPIFAGAIAREGRSKPARIAGTAFPIGGDVFVTAAHCIHDVAHGRVGALGRRSGDHFVEGTIQGAETADELDIAVLQVRMTGPVTALRWQAPPLAMASQVRSFGYAYGFDPEAGRVQIRAFVGHITCRTRFERLPGEPWAYELSFACPRGLSGSPLCTEHGNVAGVVIGNNSTEMNILTSREVSNDGKLEQIYERYESLNLGVAIAADAVLDRSFARVLAGKSIREHLQEHRLLP